MKVLYIEQEILAEYSIRMDELDCEGIYCDFLESGGESFKDAVDNWIAFSGRANINGDSTVIMNSSDYIYDGLKNLIDEVLSEWKSENPELDFEPRTDGLTENDYYWIAEYYNLSVEDYKKNLEANKEEIQ